MRVARMSWWSTGTFRVCSPGRENATQPFESSARPTHPKQPSSSGRSTRCVRQSLGCHAPAARSEPSGYDPFGERSALTRPEPPACMADSLFPDGSLGLQTRGLDVNHTASERSELAKRLL